MVTRGSRSGAGAVHQREVGPTPGAATRRQAAAEHPVLALQRLAGNQAFAQGLRPGGKFGSLLLGAEGRARSEDANAPVVRDDGPSEREADLVADRAVDALGPRASRSPVRRGVMAPALQHAVASVAPNVDLPAALPVRHDEAARRTTDAIDARAFTDGREVTVGSGELADPVEANRLVAHEAVHAARDGSVLGATGTVAAKMRGVRGALESQGGGKTTGRLRKVFGSTTKWDKVLAAVGAYEAMEDAILKKGNPDPGELAQIKPGLLQQLTAIEIACAAWEKANPDTPRKAKGGNAKAPKNSEEEAPRTDERGKAARRQAIAMLLPRVRLEIADLRSGKWASTLGLSDTQRHGELGEKASGQKNTVQELKYVTENGEFSGYFKEEKGFAPDMEGHERDVGITEVDPQYGARSVAMYRLDQLLGANVTARAEFAVHEGKMGTVLEKAKGKTAGDTTWALGAGHAKALGPGAVSTDDPVLQQALSKLQVLDAICGQLDRHQGNWYVNTDEKTGKVTGVTGIDLDMAFGKNMRDPDSREGTGENYLGMTKQVDAEFGKAILAINPDDIRNAIRGLLSSDEVEATVARFISVRDKIQVMSDKGQLIGTWDEKTAFEGRTKQATMRAGHTSYESQVAGNAITDGLNRWSKQWKLALENEGPPRLPDSWFSYVSDRELPEETRNAVKGQIDFLLGSSGVFKNPAWAGDIRLEAIPQLAVEIINELMSDSTTLAKIEVAIQERDPDRGPYLTISPIIVPRIGEFFDAVVARHGGKVKVGS